MKKNNLIIFAIDTLRPDHLGIYGYERTTSPFIDKFASESLIFDNAHSVSSWTVPSFLSLFTGCLPSHHKAVLYPKPKIELSTITTLAEMLEQQGYLTAGFHGGGFVSAEFGMEKGFQTYQTQGKNFSDNWGKVRRWIKDVAVNPFFLFYHGFDCHRPYTPSPEHDIFYPEYQGSYNAAELYRPNSQLPKTEEDVKHVVAKYDGTIRQVDDIFREFINLLKREHVYEDSIIIILADHGEEFLEHQAFDHTRTVYEEVTRVPLICHGGEFTPGRDSYPASLVDVLPTLGTMLDFKTSKNIDGIDLEEIRANGLSEDRPIFLETGYQRRYLEESEETNYKPNRPDLIRGVVYKKHKLILDVNDNPIELYDLENDPMEQNNLLEFKEGKVSQLQNFFINKSIYQTTKYEDLLSSGGLKDYTRTIKSRLRKLGYF